VPVVSDVTHLLGLPDVQFKDLLGTQNGNTLGRFANFVLAVRDFEGQQGPGDITFNLGSFTTTVTVSSSSPGSPGPITVTTTGLGSGSLLSKLGQSAQDFFTHLQGAGIHVPFLELNGDSARLSYFRDLFAGKTVDLVRANLAVDLNVSFNKILPVLQLPVIGGLGINFGGSIGLHAGGDFVLSTAGVQSGHLLDGLVIKDLHANLDLGFEAGASLTVLFASANLDIGVDVIFGSHLETTDTHSTIVTGTDLRNNNIELVKDDPVIALSLDFFVKAFGITLFDVRAPIGHFTL
jgi:hypothetical protein